MRASIALATLALAGACATPPAPPADEPPPTEPTEPTAAARRRPPPGVGPRFGPGARKSPAEAALEEAVKHARDGDATAARAAARRAIGEDPRLEEAHLLLGSLCAIERDLAGAGAAYDAGLAALPRSAALHHARGMLQLETGDAKGAVGTLETARGLAPADPEIGADLAYASLFVERAADAESLARSVRAAEPRSFAAAYAHGEALLKLDRPRDAAEAFSAARGIAPEDRSAGRRLAHAWMQAGETDKAIEVYTALLAGDGASDPRTRASAASALLAAGRAKEATVQARAALELAPDHPQLLELLAECLEKSGDRAGAKAARQRRAKVAKKDGSR